MPSCEYDPKFCNLLELTYRLFVSPSLIYLGVFIPYIRFTYLYILLRLKPCCLYAKNMHHCNDTRKNKFMVLYNFIKKVAHCNTCIMIFFNPPSVFVFGCCFVYILVFLYVYLIQILYELQYIKRITLF